MSLNSLIIIFSNLPFNWSTDYSSQTAFELAKSNNVVIYYLSGDTAYVKETIKSGKLPKLVTKYSKNIYLVNPIFLIPFRRLKFIENLNSAINALFLRVFAEWISFIKGCKKKIFWVFDPNLVFIYKYFGRKYFLLYDCVDFFAGGDIKNIENTNKNEKYLCAEADLVVANSKVLQKFLQKLRKDVKLVPQGFRINGFRIRKKKYIDLNLKSPVIGFVGGINNRLNTSLLFSLIKDNPKWNFVLWGPFQKEMQTGNDRYDEIQKIMNLPNVITGESKDKEEIPGIISQFDIGIIPYDISQNFNKYCYPMKLFEFFYLGKPVVSTDIVELRRFPELVKIGDNAKDWEKIIKDMLSKKWPVENIKKQIKLSKENSWKNKVADIVRLIY